MRRGIYIDPLFGFRTPCGKTSLEEELRVKRGATLARRRSIAFSPVPPRPCRFHHR